MNITADGTYDVTDEFNAPHNNEGVIYIDGTFGTGTVVLNYVSPTGVATAFTGATLTAGQSTHVVHGRGAKLQIVVTGALVSADFNLNYHGIK